MLQELYEEKMVTYPRTDSQYVTADMKETVKMLAEGMKDFLPFLQESGQIRGNIDRVVNNAKVSDYHARLPTKEAMGKRHGGTFQWKEKSADADRTAACSGNRGRVLL